MPLLSGCAAVVVTSAVAGAVVTTGKVVTKTAIGAGTLAVKGTGAVVSGAARAVTPSQTDDAE